MPFHNTFCAASMLQNISFPVYKDLPVDHNQQFDLHKTVFLTSFDFFSKNSFLPHPSFPIQMQDTI